ncbi:hypothetical protein Ahu01nite_063880 [Winogradskya humida]|uniref:Lipoprotein n=1 Tax=Winogradskya humida TaxID=113566 RepID=A0ABQ3ZXH4_9ACTN|nr:hypothetical protein Ahu01nite_063880 [Actinoplanes humidus]
MVHYPSAVFARGVSLLVLPLLLGGCVVPVLAPVALSAAPTALAFDYEGESAEEDTINQLLTIDNNGTDTFAPLLELTAIDFLGAELPDIEVSTIFGSDRGELVTPPGPNVDVLRFTGEDLTRVDDVRVKVLRARIVEPVEVEFDPQTELLDDDGEEVGRNERFSWVSVYNDNDVPIKVRLVYIVWDVPPPGRTQQAIATFPIRGLVTVGAGDSEVVGLNGSAEAANAKYAGVQPTSVKAYFSR